MRRTLVSSCLALAMLGATASSAGAATLTADSGASFGSVPVNTTSTARTFTLALNPGEPTFTPSVSATPPFSSSHGCGILTAITNPSCKISVTFSPPDVGPFTGTLTAGPGVPTITLSGEGADGAGKKCKKKKGKKGAIAKKCKKKKGKK